MLRVDGTDGSLLETLDDGRVQGGFGFIEFFELFFV